MRSSAEVSGRSTRATASNDGSSTSSTRSGSCRTISSGSSCSQTSTTPMTDSTSTGKPARSTPVTRDIRAVPTTTMMRAQDAGGHEQPPRILEVLAELVVAVGALGVDAQRQPHQRVEGRGDRAQIDGGTPQEKQQEWCHCPARPACGRRRSGLRAARPSCAGALPRAPSCHRRCRDRSRAGAAGRAARARGFRSGPECPAAFACRVATPDGNHDVAEKRRHAGRAVRRKRQHVGGARLCRGTGG